MEPESTRGIEEPFITPSERSDGTITDDRKIQIVSKLQTEEDEDEETDRGTWSSKWDYLLSLAGLTIGLGNVWRFPFVCYKNGGGAFLAPYLLMLILVGVPLYMLETSMGQFSSASCLTLYSVCPMFKGVGYSCCVLNVIFMMMYSVVIAYPLVFLWHSFTTQVPWAHCNNTWNTENCSLASTRNFSDEDDSVLLSPADEFFHGEVLNISESVSEIGGFQWPLVIAALVLWIFTFLCVFRGIKVLGKVVWFTATFPFFMLIILFLRGVTLPGAWNGIYFYISPDLDKLKEPKVWAAAASQIFYSLGPGYGVLTTLGSYNKFRNTCHRDAIIVPVINCITSIFAGFVVFSVLGFMAHRAGTTVDKVTAAGPALAFIIYPEALSLMPAAPVWSIFFFLTLFFVGIDSIFVHVETTILAFTDQFPRYRLYRGLIALVVCVVSFGGTLVFCTRGGIYWLTLVDQYCSSYTIILNCLCELLVFGFIYGAGRTVRDLQIMTNTHVSYIWYFAWLIISPTVLLVIFVNLFIGNTEAGYRGEVFPWWVQMIGWFTAIISMQAIPAYLIYYLSCGSRGNILQRLSLGSQPTADWGPSNEAYRTSWQLSCRQNELRNRILHPDLMKKK